MPQKYRFKNAITRINYRRKKVRPPLEFRVFWRECAESEQEICSDSMPSSWPQLCPSKSNSPEKKNYTKRIILHKIENKLFLKSFENTVTETSEEVRLTGATALTRTPYGAHSIARDFVRLSTAARAAPV